MISWKHSFESLNEEYEMTKKKKQALDNLLSADKISQSTYDSFNEKIDEAIAEIETQQKALLEKMDCKVEELEQHVKTLEMLLAKFEIKHVTGEIEEEVYQREISLLSTGLDVTRQELGTVREAVNQLSSSLPVPTTDIVVAEEVETETTENIETPQPEIAGAEETVSEVESGENPEELVEQNLPEPPVESVEGGEAETFQSQQETEETEQETWQNTEETQGTEQSGEEAQEAETVVEGEETWQNTEEPQETETTVVEVEEAQE